MMEIKIKILLEIVMMMEFIEKQIKKIVINQLKEIIIMIIHINEKKVQINLKISVIQIMKNILEIKVIMSMKLQLKLMEEYSKACYSINVKELKIKVIIIKVVIVIMLEKVLEMKMENIMMMKQKII